LRRKTQHLSWQCDKLTRAAALLVLFSAGQALTAQIHPSGEWPEYGGNLSGQRYSTAKQINNLNVNQLQPAWTFHTHALDNTDIEARHSSFEATPVLWNDALYFDSPYDTVFAIDASTGRQRWTFDPHVPRKANYNPASRGVALWHARSKVQRNPGVKPPLLCDSTIVFVATLDRRLIALDALSGEPCPAFGVHGTVDLTQGVAVGPQIDYLSYTSPPTIVGDTLILGSLVADNRYTFTASGAVRGFDVRTGRQKWSWEPLRSVDPHRPRTVGSGNAWAPLSADPAHDLVFVPTGSASVDFYGGTRPGDNRDANSVVALRASTGERIWAYQLVHHDLWDYDTPSQPVLFTFRNKIPAVAITTKTNMVFVFNRLTGEPLYPIDERPVPTSTMPGEVASPTQPFSSLPPLAPLTLAAADLNLHNADDQRFCQDILGKLVNHGIFTPPSRDNTLFYPGSIGGGNWGSAALDPSTAILYTRVSTLPFVGRQIPRGEDSFIQRHLRRLKIMLHIPDPSAPMPYTQMFKVPDSGGSMHDLDGQQGTPYLMERQALLAPGGTPCAPPPFGSIVALNINTGQKLWSVSHGQMVLDDAGSIGVGGVIVTAGGVIFAASTYDPYLRAYDTARGKLLWQGRLPIFGEATPMTYMTHGRQYVVIAAGGHSSRPNEVGDSLVAFALPNLTPHRK
jgi:quinoprotein glucose dehydrogenase